MATDGIDKEKWASFGRQVDELINGFVHTPRDAAIAEEILQKRSQDMRERKEQIIDDG